SHSADRPSVFLEAETPTRWRVIEITPALLKVQALLGPQGLQVPKAARDRVVALVQRDTPTLPIRAEIADIDLPAIDGDPAPVVQMQPVEGGARVVPAVRPFGPAGPHYLPGQGGHSVLATLDGERRRANRDLAREKAERAALVAACPALAERGADEPEWIIEGTEAVLEFLEQLHAYPQPLSVEWPEGQKLAVAGAELSAAKLSMKIGQGRDWFHIAGSLAVDDDLVVDLRDLLDRLEHAHGRFVPLGDGRFVALTRHFQAQLQRLKGVSEGDKTGRRVSRLGGLAVRGLVEEAGQVKTDKSWRDFVERLDAAETFTPQVPATLQAELRDYQVEGFAWMARLARWGAGACLADDMGLGKTVQAIAVMLTLAGEGPCLVVAPTSVCGNWVAELSRFAPTLTPHRLASAGDRAALVQGLGPRDVLIASYGLLHQEADLLAPVAWRMAVFDEAQALKNAETKRTQASQAIEAGFRLALSGTPIENDLDELWSLFNVVNPGLLGSREGFQKRFATPIQRDRDAQARHALKELIRPFILRRTKSAVLSELPPRIEQTLVVEPGPEERAFHTALREKALETIAKLREEGAGARKLHILAEITRLRRACCDPALVAPDAEVGSAKVAAFLELVDELRANRHRALVFSQFVGFLGRVRADLDALGVSYQYLDGSTPARDREKRVAAFQAGEGDLFLISLKAGGTGLNLTAADYVIHLDPWWNPAVEDQATDRAHRIGQHRPVTVYRLIVQDSIEEKILALHRDKRDLAADLLEGTEIAGRLGEEDLLALIRA
ncbi:MAG TPA: DEAD/DEAH box helicase, partial [Azospirillaceae bacterium]|nr:DEAD/DEAH box helicase [Azospirillaceae bacterium]